MNFCKIRKLVFAIVTILFLAVPSVVSAQDELVTLNIQNGNVETLIKQIEKQTKYTFVFRNKSLSPKTKVSIVKNNVTLSNVLRDVFQPLGISYKFNNNTILLLKNDAESLPSAKKEPNKGSKNRRITGSVIDKSGEPLIGARVFLKEENAGTVSDIDGNFALDVDESSVLMISYIGYEAQEIKVGNKDSFTIVMHEEASQNLNEVVVVGYGKQKKASVTAAISSVSTKDLVQSPQANVSNMLVGKMPGLIAIQRSGAPGEDASNLLIRGVSTFTSNTSPLIMIDGVERPNFDGVDPNEIESVNILKDASATAIYGVRGANGVVLVNTRKGKTGRPSFSYSGNVALQAPTALPSYLNSAEYATYYNEALKNDAYTNNVEYTPKFSEEDIQLYRDHSDPMLHPDMNWIDNFLRDVSMRTQHNFNISGGTQGVKYFLSAGYYDQQGIYKNTKLDKDHDVNPRLTRYNFRANLDFNVTKDFTVSVQLADQISAVNTPGGDNNAIWRDISYANPLNSPGLVDGKIIKVQGGLGAVNPWASLINRGFIRQNRNNLNTTFRADYNLDGIGLKGFKIHASASYDSYYHSSKKYGKTYATFAVYRNAETGDLVYAPQSEETTWECGSYSYSKNRKVYFETGINYDREFKKHHVTGLLLYNQSKYYSPSLQYYVPNAYQGIVGRATYEYDSRYMAEFDMGYNGTENFAKNHRFGFFPAVSVGWVASEEKWFPKNDYVVFLKIRASYGEVGNDKIGGDRFLYLPSSYGEADSSVLNQYHFGPVSNPSTSTMIIENKIGNPDLTWEKARKANAGIEINMFKNYLTLAVDVFKETRNNILANRSSEPMIIGANLPAYNLGKMQNMGYEFDINFRHHINKLNYWARFNYSYAHNKVLFKDEVPKRYDYQLETGKRLNQFFGLLTDGFYNSWDEINDPNRPKSSWNNDRLQPGDVKYIDVNGDGVIDQYDRVAIGYSNVPEIIYGISAGFNFKGFDFSFLLQGADHVSIKYFGRSMWPFIKGEESAKSLIKERWTEERYAAGENISFPRLSINPDANQDHNYQASDLWIRPANYLRLKNVEIGYTFGKKMLRKAGINSIRIYVSGSNLYTWTNVVDLDPEAPSSGGNSEINTYPLQRVYNFGLNLNF